MKTILVFTLAAFAMLNSTQAADVAKPAQDTRVYEMRTYWAAPGKLDALNARFRDHTLKLFEKHGMTNVGYFMPIDNKDQKLVYFLAYPDRAARDASWKAFLADPVWQKAHKTSEINGKLVADIKSVFLKTTDYSPALKIEAPGNRVIELRTYIATPKNLELLNTRFRDHTMKLFEKYGMTNLIYWNYMADQPNADKMLVYLLAHKSQEAGKASFDAFRKDEDWLKARKASEEKGGGSLTVDKIGVQSEYMVPTDYSPLK